VLRFSYKFGLTLAVLSAKEPHHERFSRRGDLRVEGIATSQSSDELARQSGIPLITPRRGLLLDLDIDGADEIAPDLSLIKGSGGALFREKVVARASQYFLVLADSSKQVPQS
jgi:ribose 5-phosphate isomerase A